MRNLILVIFTFSCSLAYSQTQNSFASNEMKYWKIRAKLVGDKFNRDVHNGLVQVGTSSGGSIPAISLRKSKLRNYYKFNLGWDCENSKINNVTIYTSYVNGIPNSTPIIDPRDDKDLKGVITFDDNSLIELGKYIGVLASEYSLLARDNQNTDETLNELYYALLAIDRLDYGGESLYNITPDLNGFMMRNDADEHYALNTTGQNIDLVNASKACPKDCNCSESGGATILTNNAMSQDEVIGLLMGLKIMDIMIPSGTYYNGMDLKSKMSEIAERTIKYVKKAGTTNFWAIVDPTGDHRVCRGSMAIESSFPLAAIGNSMPSISGLQNGWSLSVGDVIWKWKKAKFSSVSASDFLLFTSSLNIPVYITSALDINPSGVISFVPGEGTGKFTHDGAYKVNLFLRLGASSPRTVCGRNIIGSVAIAYDKQLYELVASVIRHYSPVLPEIYWRNLFNEQTCSCNCAEDIDASGSEGCDHFVSQSSYSFPNQTWSVEDMWSHRYVNPDESNTVKEFNGLDYLLAYNLYRWKYFSSGYSSKIRKSISSQFPFIYNYHTSSVSWVWNWLTLEYIPIIVLTPHSETVGNMAKPLVYKAVYSIASGNTVMNGQSGNEAKVHFEAGSDIHLNAGFHATKGSVFKANIKEYDCTPDVISLTDGYLVNYKTQDSTTQSTYLEDFDTISVIQDITDTSLIDVDTSGIDSSIWHLSNIGDTTIIYLDSNYVFDNDGNIVPDTVLKGGYVSPTGNDINIFPIPSSLHCTLVYSIYSSSKLSIYVTTETGQRISQVIDEAEHTKDIGRYQETLDTEHLSNGIYYCHLLINGRHVVKKFSVVH